VFSHSSSSRYPLTSQKRREEGGQKGGGKREKGGPICPAGNLLSPSTLIPFQAYVKITKREKEKEEKKRRKGGDYGNANRVSHCIVLTSFRPFNVDQERGDRAGKKVWERKGERRERAGERLCLLHIMFLTGSRLQARKGRKQRGGRQQYLFI